MVNGPSDVDPSKLTQLRSRGQLMHPGTCAICGNGTCDEGYLDTGIYYDYEGHVYICLVCVRTEVLPQIGAIPYEEAEYIKNERQADATRILELENELVETKEKYRELAMALDVIRRGSDLTLNDPTPIVDEDGQEESGSDDKDLTLPPESTDSGKSGSKKPSKGKGPDDSNESSGSDSPISL